MIKKHQIKLISIKIELLTYLQSYSFIFYKISPCIVTGRIFNDISTSFTL